MKIAVVGGGYVGLVSAICFAEIGHSVHLIEIDERKVEAINSGTPLIYEKSLDKMLSSHVGNHLNATTDYVNILNSEITFICVGTPSGINGDADLSMVKSASKSIGEALQDSSEFHIVAVKSTVPPGTTEKLVIPEILENSNKGIEKIGFAMNPEFLREGLAIQDFMHPDRIIIGSQNKSAGDAVESVYAKLDAPIVRTSILAAEMIKYTSNAFLASKISFSIEIGNICKRLGINVYDVMNGVGMDHRISPFFFNAGVGFGGSCFPKDVLALIRLAESIGENPSLLKSVIDVNNRQPLRMVELLEKKIGNIRGKRIAILGLAFKNDTNDIRDSRSLLVIAELKRKGAAVSAYDPLANSSAMRLFPDIDYRMSAADALDGADACLVMTEWPQFSLLDKEFDLMRSRVIIEGRKVLNCEGVEGICW